MVIVVICKNNCAFECNILVQCYFERCCQGKSRTEEFGCCGRDGTNPCGYVSGRDAVGPCFEVACP